MRCVLLAVASFAASAQTPPAFEVATVKPSAPDAVMAIRRSGHRIVTNGTTLQFLITWAYDIQSDRLFAKPPWLNSDRFDVTGAAPQDEPSSAWKPGEPTIFQRRMQTLLADRFKLATHRETREMTLYTVTVAKSGFKPHVDPAPEVMGQQPFKMTGPGRLFGTQVTVEMLAKVLSDQLGRTVIDQSGLKGVFDFRLDWTPDRMPRADGLPAPPDTRSGPSLFTALEEQLGLKLETRRGPVDVVVIDHVDRSPTGN
jgi:uncharacterized protein (TIGR03435 family)